MEEIKVEVNLKGNVMDPQGLAVKKALNNMGFDTVSEVRIGKVFHIKFDGKKPDKKDIEQFCDKLLSNPVIENFEIFD